MCVHAHSKIGELIGEEVVFWGVGLMDEEWREWLLLPHNEAFTYRCSYSTQSLLKQCRYSAVRLLSKGGTFSGSARDFFFN